MLLDKRGNNNKRQGATRLAAIRVSNIDDSLEVSIALSLDDLIVVW